MTEDDFRACLPILEAAMADEGYMVPDEARRMIEAAEQQIAA